MDKLSHNRHSEVMDYAEVEEHALSLGRDQRSRLVTALLDSLNEVSLEVPSRAISLKTVAETVEVTTEIRYPSPRHDSQQEAPTREVGTEGPVSIDEAFQLLREALSRKVEER